jgi:hypothetical protein
MAIAAPQDVEVPAVAEDAEPVTLGQFKCIRCGSDHNHGLVVAVPLKKETKDATHWATCPATKEPILFKLTMSATL